MAGEPAKKPAFWIPVSALTAALGFGLCLTIAPIAEAQPRASSHPPGKTLTAKARTAKPAAQKAPRKQKSAEPARRAADAEGAGFTVDGRRVRVDVVKAETETVGEEKTPAVLILHGAGGLGDGTLFYPQAKALAERGISAFVVHYFDGIPQSHKAAPSLHDEREKVIAEAVSYVQKQEYVDAERIGVFGLSLGGFHALSLGSRDERIQAVVNVVGAMPAEVQRRGVHRMPPTLVLHGERDRTVPVRRAHDLVNLLENVGAEHEVKIYQGEGHTFRGSAKEDSITRTVDFFERHLSGDRGLLEKEFEFNIALAPIVPEDEALPIRALTIADEALGLQPEQVSRAPAE